MIINEDLDILKNPCELLSIRQQDSKNCDQKQQGVHNHSALHQQNCAMGNEVSLSQYKKSWMRRDLFESIRRDRVRIDCIN